MPVESDDDRMIFLDPRDFGVEADYAPRDGSATVTVAGNFDAPETNFNPNQWPGHPYQRQEGAHLTSTAPTFLCRVADLPDGGKAKSKLTLNGVTYRVQEPKPDGTGMTVLVLMEDGD